MRDALRNTNAETGPARRNHPGATPGSRTLIVRHGPGRGRAKAHLQTALDHLAAHEPALRARLVVHETGACGPPALDRVDAVVFWLADPLRELYPECFSEAIEIANAARARGIRLVNPPEALSNSVKSVQVRLWREAGIPTPPCERFEDRRGLDTILGTMPFPVVLRGDLLHSQTRTHFLATRAGAAALDDRTVPFPGVASPFVDTRASFVAAAPGSVWARLHHKKRAFVFGDIVTPNHVFFSKEPIVGLDTSTFGRLPGRAGQQWLRLVHRVRPLARACLDADNAYWSGPPEQEELLRRASRAIGQEFVAIDYSSRADGSIVIWEANPYFSLKHWSKSALPRERRVEARHRTFFEAIGRFFSSLMDVEARTCR